MKFHVLLCLGLLFGRCAMAQRPFKVIAFFTGKNDQAHISFVREAHQ